MDNRAIGVFDSGLGGLTAVKELHNLLPNENIVYLGDTGRVPYGSRSRETIIKYAQQDIDFLLKKEIKMVVAACGTVSSTLPKEISGKLPVPYVDIVMPAAQEACALSSRGRIGVVGTNATLKSNAFGRAMRGIRGDIKVYGNPCPLLVHLVENGMVEPDNEITTLAVKMYLEPLMKENIDTLILGCTHYPLLTEIIADIMGPGVTLIDSGAAAARVLRQTLSDRGALAQRDHGTLTLYASDRPEDFGALAGQFLRRPLESAVQHVDIERY